jgi:uncharacterized protein YoxC
LSIELFLGIITVVLIILLGFIIYFILNIKNMLRSVESFVKTTQEPLILLLSELRESVERLNRIIKDIEDSTKNVQHLSKAIGELGALIDELNNFVKRTGLSFSIKTASIGVGIKTALGVLARGIIKKGGDADEG